MISTLKRVLTSPLHANMNCKLLNKNPLELCIFFFAMLQCNFLLNNDITQHCVKVSFVLAFGVFFFLLFAVFTQQHIYTTNFYNMASAFIAKPFYSSPRAMPTTIVKVIYFQNEFMKSVSPKIRMKYCQDF